MSLVVAEDVSRTFGTGPRAVVALHGAWCRVDARSRIAVVGPSGSGKSTLIQLLAGLEEPTAGTITWPDLPSDAPSLPGQIGVVFQGQSLMPPLDVLQNVMYPLLLADVPEADAARAAAAALTSLGIGDLATHLPDELSGGQAQRVAVARVIAARPRLILADEPTGRLDAMAAQLVLDVLITASDILDAGLVVSTHDPDIAGRLERRWTMHEGRLWTGTDGVSEVST